MSKSADLQGLLDAASRIRRTTLDIIHYTGSPHIGSSFSIVEILAALYFHEMKVSPETAADPERDRFILSKGHACATLYATLYHRGFMSREDLDGFAVDGGLLEHHPKIDLKRGIEVSTGSLGHGLSIGAGMALAARLDGRPVAVHVLMSDGELNEGSVWEAAMFSGHHCLENLTAYVDFNKIQALGCTRDIIDMEPLADKWRSFGWNALECDGHDIKGIIAALESRAVGRPNILILHTVKGKGVSFMEDKLLWHYRCPDKDEYERAVRELSA
jgi:transketolase